MTAKKITTAVLLVFVAVSIVYFIGKQMAWFDSQSDPKTDNDGLDNSDVPHRIIAYYFHGTTRCPTCLTIEDYAKEAIETGFSDDLKKGTLEWHAINFDESANEHFVKDYNLYAQALIVIDSTAGQTARWKNLEQIWDLVGEKEIFQKYIRDEIRQYLENI